MAGIAVVDIREPLEPAREGLAHGGLALRARSPGVWTARHLEHAVIGKVGMMASRSCALKASHKASSVGRMSLITPSRKGKATSVPT